LSYRHNNLRKAKKASRDLILHGATMAQLDRLHNWNIIPWRMYDQLINPLLEQDTPYAVEGFRTSKGKRIRSWDLETYKSFSR
jgi:hypothetical protein